jgi:thioesterase domain-containing protein
VSAAALAALEAVWRDELPITTALGIAVVESRDGALVLRMPLAPNRNHKGTAFAGSLSALTTLAGWSLLWLALRDAGVAAHVVIQDSTMRYLLPVHSDALATAEAPEPAEIEAMLAMLARRGRARIAVQVVVRDVDGVEVGRFAGRYVVGRM